MARQRVSEPQHGNVVVIRVSVEVGVLDDVQDREPARLCAVHVVFTNQHGQS